MDSFIFLALLMPAVWSCTNVIDKYILSWRVKDTLAYARVAALVVVGYAVVLGLFLDWSSVKMGNLMFPILAGVMFGFEGYAYYTVLSQEDVSHAVGLLYSYPLFLALFAYVFLGEVLPPIGYAGVALILVGTVWLSYRRSRVRVGKGWWAICMLILLVVVYELLTKVASGKLPVLNGLAVMMVVYGLVLSAGLVLPRLRRASWREAHNIRWAFLAEAFTMAGSLGFYYLLVYLPATVVGSIGALQPLFALLYERVIDSFGGRISADHLLLPKLGAISLIVAGVAIMYGAGLI